MHILKRHHPKTSSSRKGKKTLLRRVFSSEKKLSQSSLKNLKSLVGDNDDGKGSIGVSASKLSQAISSNSLPGLAEADSFESIWTTRSDSSIEEATEIHEESAAAKEVVYSGVESSPSFEQELSLVLQETIEKLPELEANVPEFNVDQEEKGLEIECSDPVKGEDLPTPPSSTNAVFSGDFCDFSFASESTVESANESAAALLPKTVEKSRSQDIFRSKEPSVQSPIRNSEKIDDDLLQVRFTPSFEGIEMTQSFEQLQTIKEEPSWYTPSLSFEMDGTAIRMNTRSSMLRGWKMMVRPFIATAMIVFLLAVAYDNRFALDKVGSRLNELVTPVLGDLLVQHATDGPVVKRTFYNNHHTVVGVWLK
ncbi:unnamed protein product [Cylindrotheca closterium]|uniref:Uncharacterized protein n=1 Tax=Cylindrotheca closterium TaxID=2856 RepID=A0AAD2JHF7_9STRA|nr:unnamed protein product [Cylindrotheca closterium]